MRHPLHRQHGKTAACIQRPRPHRPLLMNGDTYINENKMVRRRPTTLNRIRKPRHGYLLGPMHTRRNTTMGWMALAQIGGSLLDSWIGADSAKKANKTNVKLQREQASLGRAHEQHRYATTNGGRQSNRSESASSQSQAQAPQTPSVTPATVEPENRSSVGDAVFKAMTAKQMAANTELTTQQAPSTKSRPTYARAGFQQELSDAREQKR